MSPLRGSPSNEYGFPNADALGYLMSPLRGWPTGSAHGTEHSALRQVRLREEEGDLDLRVVIRVGAVDGVLLDRLAELGADGAGVGFLRIGRPHELAQLGDGVVALERSNVNGTGHHVLHEVAVERTLFVDGVESLGLALGEGDLPEAENPESCLLDAGDDPAEVALANRFRLDDGKGAV